MHFIFSTTHASAFHIDLTTLVDVTYELVPRRNEGSSEAQVNQAVIPEDLNQSSVVELSNTAQEGKPRRIILYFTSYAVTSIFICLYLIVHLSCRSSMKL